jgi:hypothetical protein
LVDEIMVIIFLLSIKDRMLQIVCK